MKPFLVRAAIAALCALSLSGCIDSADPILSDAQPVLGSHPKLQLYSLRKGFAYEPEQVTYAWNGKFYAHAGGGMKDIAAFSLHPFEAGDYIIQTVPARRGQVIEYALLHKIAGGVHLVIVIDEADADEATRNASCKPPGGTNCRIETREQLMTFARATATRQKDDGGLVIRLPDDSDKPKCPARSAPPPR